MGKGWSIGVLVVLTACGGAGPSATTPASPGSPPPPPKPTIAEKMDGHFATIMQMQKAIILGNLDQAREYAGEFTTRLRNADYPEGWQPHLQSVRKALFTIVDAEDLTKAAAATARAGAACGGCHRSLGVQAMPAGAQPPFEKPEGLSQYMWQHLWAAESMWNGVVGPSNEAWREGAAVLAKAGLFPEGEGVQLTDEMRALAGELNELGQRASGLEAADERSELYGKFLGACAQCHQLYFNQVD